MKWLSSKFSSVIILVLAIVLWRNLSYATPETPVERILASEGSYDEKEVSVFGTISKLKVKTSWQLTGTPNRVQQSNVDVEVA